MNSAQAPVVQGQPTGGNSAFNQNVNGDFGSSIGNMFSGNLDHDRQVNLQQRNMEFQHYMSGSAYQRGAQDLKAAGLNPALMTNGGSPAQSGSAPASAQSSGKGIGTVVSTAFGLGKMVGALIL